VLSSPEGDVLFVPSGSGIDELAGETGALRRRHQSPLANVDNVVRDGRHLVLLSSSNDRVAVWDPVGDIEIARHGGYAGPVNALPFDGALLIVEVERGSISRQAKDGDAADTFVAGMRTPAGLAGTSRDLWVADRASGTILQLFANGERLVEPIEVAHGLAQPEGLGVTPAGSLIVAETGAGRLSRIDPQTRTVFVIDDQLALDAAPGSGRNPIGTFAGIAIGACGTIYVTADATGEIIRYAPVGPVVCQYGE
jgi:DNA-binding beta-propeller fold protein YncE